MAREFDLVVIGTGSAASSAANTCRAAGWSVAVIDSRPFGGTCALRGCDPKKMLVAGADLVDWSRRMQGKGVEEPPLAIDWPALMRFKRTFTDNVPPDREKGFRDAGIETFHGRARFTGERSVQVGDETLTGRYVLVASGMRPATLGIPGEEHLTNSTEFLELEALPRRIVFVGGGFISFEFAHIAARAGAEVRILHRGERPLGGFEASLVDRLVEGTRRLGVDVRLGTPVHAIKRCENELVVRCGTSPANGGSGEDAGAGGSDEGGGFTCEADLVVHGAGRVPEIDDLDLERAGVQRERRGVSVNEYLQSVSNPGVYAAGDAAASPGLPLTPVAGLEGEVAATNMLKGNQRKPNYAGTASVVFTLPPLATVGLTEAAACARGLKFRTHEEDTSEWYSSLRLAAPYSGFKTLIEEETGLILGAHLLGPHAEETINLFALAIRKGLTTADLDDMLYSYPSHASDVWYML